MYRLIATLALTSTLAGPLAAQEGRVVGEAEFEALAEGTTHYFTQNGLPYGAEQFFANRRSLWQFSDGTCTRGTWFYVNPEEICFIYDYNDVSQCWIFTKRGDSFFARLANLPEFDPSELRLDRIDNEPLNCPGPDVGA